MPLSSRGEVRPTSCQDRMGREFNMSKDND
jgi:hypothetical protein